MVVINKPSGLLVHRSNIDKHETRFALQMLRDQLGQHVYPVHRLDKPTSGLILFGLNPEAAARLQKQMEENTASKEYLLVCRGYCPESGIIDHPLKPIEDFKNKRSALKAPKPAQTATTEFQRLNTIELPVAVDKYPTSRYSLVKAKILTGRKHQIRRHFKHISHPIIGCPKYGKSTHNRYFSTELEADRLLLHSYRMTLNTPSTNETIEITAPLTDAFQAIMEKFDWQLPG